jgi:D-glycero-D-manno-heptose 1,7-bisphosphate phosphatase
MKKAVFLDRDGVINREKEYLSRIEDFEFIPGVLASCREFVMRGYAVVVITNQSGIARGYYDLADFEKLTLWMKEQFLNAGAPLTAVYCCPHHPEITGGCECRKPEPALILQAAQEYNLDLSQSILVGDKESDVGAGLNAGIPIVFLVTTGHDIDSDQTKATKVIDSLDEIFPFLDSCKN